MKNYSKTLRACYLGLITQAIAANFAPLLFWSFHSDFNISLGQIALIPAVFYVTQLVVDLICAKYVDAIGYRKSIVASQLLAGLGLIGFTQYRIALYRNTDRRVFLRIRERPY